MDEINVINVTNLFSYSFGLEKLLAMEFFLIEKEFEFSPEKLTLVRPGALTSDKC